MSEVTIATSELQVSEGLANDYDLRTLNYGILLHRRRSDGSGVQEDFEYHALVDSNTNPLRLPGIGPDDDRIDFERGHGTSLDQRLVRRSAFRFAPTTATGQGVGSLQQLFLVVRPKKGTSIQPTLGLKWIGGPDLAPKVCPPEGIPALRIWCTEEWQDSTFVETETYDGDVTEWAAKLGRRAEAVIANRVATVKSDAVLGQVSATPRGANEVSHWPPASAGPHAASVATQPNAPHARVTAKWTGKHTLMVVALLAVIGVFAAARLQSTSARSENLKPKEQSRIPASEAVAIPAPPAPPSSATDQQSAGTRKLVCEDNPFPLHCERKLREQQGEKP